MDATGADDRKDGDDVGIEDLAHAIDYEGTRMWKFVHQLHMAIPTHRRVNFMHTVRRNLEHLQDINGDIGIGDGCTGSGIQFHFWGCLLQYWTWRLGAKKKPWTVKHTVSAESMEEKQTFIVEQHESVGCLLGDVKDPEKPVWECHEVAGGGTSLVVSLVS